MQHAVLRVMDQGLVYLKVSYNDNHVHRREIAFLEFLTERLVNGSSRTIWCLEVLFRLRIQLYIFNLFLRESFESV